MKRIKCACLEQVIHFELKDNIDRTEAVIEAEKEYQNYKARLDRAGVRYKITDEKKEADGSVTISIKKQYNSYDVGNFLD
ncbi:MAG: hypothetical protein ACI4JJ_07815 [Huintestinicola sp.]